MAILNMASSKAEAEQMVASLLARGIPAGNIRDISDSNRPTISDHWTAEKAAAFQLWLYESYIGRSISDRERNGYNDSDWYMLVMEPDGTFAEHMFATTRGWSYPTYGSKPDATEEVKAAYAAHLAKLSRIAREREDRIEEWTPRVGKTVEVVKGRKVARGTVGIVIWVGAGHKYTPNYGTLSISALLTG